jgi:CubicO group peptidase (beta-lactamase class C family)
VAVPRLPDIPSVSVPRLPGVPDPLRRVRVPRDLESVTTRGPEDEPAAGGMTGDQVERIWRAATDLYRSGVHPAVQVCVRRQGVVVLDRAIGHARGNGPHDGADVEKVPATPETPFLIYSGAKAITAFVVHLLHERGLLDIRSPVCEYIPDYDCESKGEITIGHVLAHRAGVPNLPPEAFDLDNAHNREFLVRLLCEAKPVSEAGSRLAYHAVSGGYILGEVVQRVTGKDIRQVLAEEILDPLGFRWTNYGVDESEIDEVALNYVTGPPTGPPLSNFLQRALGLPFDELVHSTNDPRFLTAVVPSANIVTSANELSRFYEIMRRGGELEGVRVMEPDTIRQALEEQSRLEVDWSLGFPTRFSYGLMLGAQLLSLYGRDTQHAFGHLGFTNMLAWADPERGTAVAVMTNGKPVLYPELPRFYNLMQRITSETPKVAPGEMLI